MLHNNLLRNHSTASNERDQNNVFTCACLKGSLWQWCHWSTPTSHNTHINTPSPSSLPGSTSQLSLLPLSADGALGHGGGGYEERRLGVGGSTAEQMQKPLLGSPGMSSFPATPQPCSCPGTSCPDDRTKQTRNSLTVMVGYGRSRGGVV